MSCSLSPRSPPPLGLLEIYGKRKQMLQIQVLDTQISLLQEELKSLEGPNPASRCWKELDTFVGCKSDPFTPKSRKISKSHGFWKRIRLKLLFIVSVPWVCFSRCCCCCLVPKKIVKGWCCCMCCSSSSSSSSSNSKCCGTTLKTKKSVPGCCCKVVKILTNPCSYCLVCFSCNNCCNCKCHTCSHQ